MDEYSCDMNPLHFNDDLLSAVLLLLLLFITPKQQNKEHKKHTYRTHKKNAVKSIQLIQYICMLLRPMTRHVLYKTSFINIYRNKN